MAAPGSSGAPGAGRRIASGTVARAIGEVVAKAASVVFYIVIARELGEGSFGDFIFGVSLAGVLLTGAGFGTDELIARDVARDREAVHRLFGDALALKTGIGALLIGVIALIVVLGPYSGETAVAVLLLGVAVWIEMLTKTVQAVMQAHEEMKYIAASLIVQRVSTALVGIAVLIAGGDLIAVSLVVVGGAVLGLTSALFWLYRRVSRPRRDIVPSRWAGLIKSGVPLGLIGVLYLLLLRLDATLLSFLSGGDNVEVGHYGAAYRLIEATMFVSWAFGGAVLPWFSRERPAEGVSLARGFELGLKAITAMLLPIAIVFGVLAEPLIDLIYGASFEDAVLPLQLLAGMTVLYGINTYTAVLMISRDRPGAFTRPAAVVLAQNVAFNFVLIPLFGAAGAAANAVLSGLLLAILTMRSAIRIAGPISPMRAFAPPVAAGLAFAAVLVLGGSELSAVPLMTGSVVYVAGFLTIERVFFSRDFRLYQALVGRRGSVPSVAELPAPDSVEP